MHATFGGRKPPSVVHKVVFRDAAVADLTALYDYIVENNSPEIAIGYIRRIQEMCMRLATFPERGRRRDDILPGLRTIGFERRARSRRYCREGATAGGVLFCFVSPGEL
jgi:toxin ParE1/3/4